MALISVKEQSGTPKYKQIVHSIENALTQGTLKKGDALPSLNHIRDQFSLSRDTVLMAFNELKNRGIVESVVGKGYYIKSEHIQVTQKIFLLFDELNAFKEDLYTSFINELDKNIQVDIFFHHFNEDMFRKLIYDNLGNYNHYVIMPANLKNTSSVIEKLPSDKVFILDQTNEELADYPAIYQNFETDIFNSLMQAQNLIENYKKVVLLFPDKKQPLGMLNGFQKYRKHTDFPCEVINSLKDRTLQKGEVYLILDDQNLILFIKKLKDQNLILGQDIGVISYNDTLMKEIVEGGITTISTDFNQMGKRLAQMILNKEHLKIENPNALIIRKSL
ncbi:GntR family transcriptional regulator [Subsaxibacter sp. CAU 1640]|uniref:GntR family transcriptional regulator n=1 Tax=Subsaxibacter sp. CAU 1640 TaxID=2933271 RepID=UPI00200356F6|nr:winged helix-turn-helix domain-containing protein [Subsaxibacter sp. CAU 1640]MCK7589063.1 GntR family transcriptional regulator [Subsaxibacter sp. CAU 1640]